MPANLEAAIRAIVSEEVSRALAPYQSALKALATLSGGRRGPGRPKGSRNHAKGDASKFSVGHAVRYKQGRGEFEAKVVRVDVEANSVTVERVKDGKKVTRPAGLIYRA